MADVDFLVRPGEFHRVARILEGLGYRLMRTGKHNYAMPAKGDAQSFIFDLHDRLPYLSRNAFLRLWDRSVTRHINDTPVLLLDACDELVYLAYHAAVQHGDMSSVWMRDIDCLVRYHAAGGGPDWPAAARVIRRHNLGLPCAVLFSRLAAEWGAPVPERFIRACRPRGLNTPAARLYRYLVRRPGTPEIGHVLRLFTQRGFAKLFYMFSYAFPPPDFLNRRYNTRTTLDTTAASLLRPFRGARMLAALAARILRRNQGRKK
jgi:hypothetical protein